MGQFFKNIFFFVTLVLSLYLCFFYFIEKGLKQSNYLNLTEWNEIYGGKVNADLIINGSSRAYKQVDPKIMDSLLNLNSYNLGLDGYHIPMQITKFKIYKNHNIKPKIVIHIIDHFSLKQRDNLYNLEQFIPYLKDTVLSNQLKKYDGLNWSDFKIPYAKYIGKSKYITAGLFEYFNIKHFKSAGYKGYYPKKNGNWNSDFDSKKKENKKGKTIVIDSKVLQQFNAYLSHLDSNQTPTFIVYAPEYIEFQSYITNRDSIVNIYKNICNKYKNISFIDYNKNLICKDKNYFYNPTHLNRTGAELFTLQLAKQIKNMLIID